MFMILLVDHLGDLAIVECQGRLFPNDAAFALRDAVMSQADSNAIMVDLSQVYALGDSVLVMLIRLRRWALEHNVDFRLFNPTSFVCQTFEETGLADEFHITDTLEEIFALLARSSGAPYTHAA